MPTLPLPAAPQSPGARHARRALALLVTGAVAIGMAPVFVRLSETGPSATAFWRLALAIPLFWAWHAFSEGRSGRPSVRPSRGDLFVLILPGVLFGLDLGIWRWSIKFTTVANATLFANCQPIVVALGAWVLLGERFGKLFVLGLACAMVGVVGVVGAGASVGGERTLGDALGLLTALSYGSYILSVRKARLRFSTARIMSYALPVSCILLMVFALVAGERIVPATAQGWLPLVGLALICQIGGQGLIAYALATLPASFSSVSLLVQPLAAAAFAWFILAEPLGPFQAAGGALVLAGIYLARCGSRPGSSRSPKVPCCGGHCSRGKPRPPGSEGVDAFPGEG